MKSRQLASFTTDVVLLLPHNRRPVRRPDPRKVAAARTRRAALLRLVFDLFVGVVQVAVFAVMTLGKTRRR